MAPNGESEIPLGGGGKSAKQRQYITLKARRIKSGNDDDDVESDEGGDEKEHLTLSLTVMLRDLIKMDTLSKSDPCTTCSLVASHIR
jgi:hypothetical protein